MHPLDNPAWNALHESHRAYARGDAQIRLYLPEFAPFGGIHPEADKSAFQNLYVPDNDFIYLIGDMPDLPSGYVLEKQLVCLQMICPEPIDMVVSDAIQGLTQDHARDLSALVNLVQPGYFREKTSQMGQYYGIYLNGILAAVTGERMRMNGYTEISAVVTHPDFTGRGLASQLVAHAVNINLAAGQLPFLHVTEDNVRAIALYEKLGFQTRRKMDFWKITI
ncbi:MAG: GNAT family N-acetyltransferase [Bacteroidetes bacterium]|nr:GNAT family N-acetyltransferase [Bacteroidota bacterium]